MDEKCVATVYPKDRMGVFHGYGCGKPAKVVRDGKPYCKMHDPDVMEERNKNREEKKTSDTMRLYPAPETTAWCRDCLKERKWNDRTAWIRFGGSRFPITLCPVCAVKKFGQERIDALENARTGEENEK